MNPHNIANLCSIRKQLERAASQVTELIAVAEYGTRQQENVQMLEVHMLITRAFDDFRFVIRSEMLGETK